jgi:virginiamycin B lyase
VAVAAVACVAAASAAAFVAEYPVPATSAGPFGLAEGPNRTVWVGNDSELDVFDLHGHMTTITVPTPNAAIGPVLTGGNGTMWFTERLGNKIGRVDPEGTVTEYLVPSTMPCPGQAAGTSVPNGLARAKGRGVWFTEFCGNAIGHLRADGTIVEYPVPTPDSGPLGITRGPDGSYWFVERTAAKVGRITTDGVITEWALTPGAFPNRITVGPDGALWFTELNANAVGRITTSGVLTENPLPAGVGPVGIVSAHGSLWIVERTANAIGQIDTSGTLVASYPIPTPASGAILLATGPRGTLWWNEASVSRVGVLDPTGRIR